MYPIKAGWLGALTIPVVVTVNVEPLTFNPPNDVMELAVTFPLTSNLEPGAVVPMPTLPDFTTSVDPPTEKALPVTVRVEPDKVIGPVIVILPVFTTDETVNE